MRLLVCGGRDFADYQTLYNVLDQLPFTPTILIHGDAKGADRMAQAWAVSRGIHSAAVPALWDKLGKSAGHARNGAMILLQPQYCVAFAGGKGTADMIRQCRKLGIPVWEIK